jgi:hypothetical protein
MHQLTDPFYRELPGLLLESLHHHSPDVFIPPESTVFQHFLERAEHN